MWQIVLQISVRGADKNQVRKLLFEFFCRVHLPGYSDQRIFWWLISIRWRVKSGPLNVWIVVGTSGSNVHQLNFHFLENRQEAFRLAKLMLRGISGIHSEAPAVRD